MVAKKSVCHKNVFLESIIATANINLNNNCIQIMERYTAHE